MRNYQSRNWGLIEYRGKLHIPDKDCSSPEMDKSGRNMSMISLIGIKWSHTAGCQCQWWSDWSNWPGLVSTRPLFEDPETTNTE